MQTERGVCDLDNGTLAAVGSEPLTSEQMLPQRSRIRLTEVMDGRSCE
ncbi:hypothetical protein [Actinoallomurus sp. CA-150999]